MTTLKIELIVLAEKYKNGTPVDEKGDLFIQKIIMTGQTAALICYAHQSLSSQGKDITKITGYENYIIPNADSADNGFYGEHITIWKDGSFDISATNGKETISFCLKAGAVILDKALKDVNVDQNNDFLKVHVAHQNAAELLSISRLIKVNSTDVFKSLSQENFVWKNSNDVLIANNLFINTFISDSNGDISRIINGIAQQPLPEVVNASEHGTTANI